jgi:hypothetical protein
VKNTDLPQKLTSDSCMRITNLHSELHICIFGQADGGYGRSVITGIGDLQEEYQANQPYESNSMVHLSAQWEAQVESCAVMRDGEQRRDVILGSNHSHCLSPRFTN